MIAVTKWLKPAARCGTAGSPTPLSWIRRPASSRKKRAMLVGTPQMIADHMEGMFVAGACDGFVLHGNVTPLMFEEFGRMVVPELQRRGVYRREYASTTMRGNLRS
jgi:alkanesulfonate monooxygenase SsuD/methylene tetrahydromethanopterin reductase-like flavin-dependent oxidoreductase (luciferase family)